MRIRKTDFYSNVACRQVCLRKTMRFERGVFRRRAMVETDGTRPLWRMATLGRVVALVGQGKRGKG